MDSIGFARIAGGDGRSCGAIWQPAVGRGKPGLDDPARPDAPGRICSGPTFPGRGRAT